MRISTAIIMFFAGSIATIDAAAGNTQNQQDDVSTKKQLDPLWDCELPDCNWNACESALLYSGVGCIKSLESLTNADW